MAVRTGESTRFLGEFCVRTVDGTLACNSSQIHSHFGPPATPVKSTVNSSCLQLQSNSQSFRAACKLSAGVRRSGQPHMCHGGDGDVCGAPSEGIFGADASEHMLRAQRTPPSGAEGRWYPMCGARAGLGLGLGWLGLTTGARCSDAPKCAPPRADGLRTWSTRAHSCNTTSVATCWRSMRTWQ